MVGCRRVVTGAYAQAVIRTGFFLALEGGEGSGKSTLARALAEQFRDAGRSVVVTREPGGSPAAEAIRDLLLSDRMAGADPWCEALLFAAARADHVASVIGPALASGSIVICDRFVDSSVAYQGVARGLGEAAVRGANAVAVGDAAPDLTVVLDIDPQVGLARAVGHNRMEAEGLAFHAQVRAAFLEFAARRPQAYLIVPADQPVPQVVATIATVVRQRMEPSA